MDARSQCSPPKQTQELTCAGVDLTGIIKSLKTGGEEDRLAVFQALATALEAGNTDAALAGLATVEEKLKDKDMCMYAGQHNALPLLIKTAEHVAGAGSEEGLVRAFGVLARLLDGQPDLLSPPPGLLTEDVFAQDIPVNAATATLCQIMDARKESVAVTVASLNAVARACLKHEVNRQAFVDSGAVELILHTLQAHASHALAVTAAADCLRMLLLDDDARVPFGKAHTKARGIIHDGDGLGLLIAALKILADNHTAVAPLATTVARLAMRTEICQQIVDLGGVATMLTSMSAHTQAAAVQQVCACARLCVCVCVCV
jgi:armadillo repeat-containing protein 6